MINDINILVILKGPNNIYIYIITIKQGIHKKCLKLPSKNYNSLCEKKYNCIKYFNQSTYSVTY